MKNKIVGLKLKKCKYDTVSVTVEIRRDYILYIRHIVLILFNFTKENNNNNNK